MLAAAVMGPVAVAQHALPAAGTPQAARREQADDAVEMQPGSAGGADAREDDAAEVAGRGKVAEAEGGHKVAGQTLTEVEVQQLEQLKSIDRETRQHEQAHQTVGGPYAGNVRYDYQSGPDGRRYAVGGEVPIDYGEVSGDPRATVEKMETVIAAALAPMEPSSKDLQVAARARQTLFSAQVELMQMQQSPSSTSENAEGPASSRRAEAPQTVAAAESSAPATAAAHGEVIAQQLQHYQTAAEADRAPQQSLRTTA